MTNHCHGIFASCTFYSKCQCNTQWIIFSKYHAIIYNNNLHYIHYLCCVFCHLISLSAAIFDPIPALHLKGFRQRIQECKRLLELN